jgi:hypothetical protein
MDGGAVIDPHVLFAILALLPALVLALGVAICELVPNDRQG